MKVKMRCIFAALASSATTAVASVRALVDDRLDDELFAGDGVKRRAVGLPMSGAKSGNRWTDGTRCSGNDAGQTPAGVRDRISK
jgi:hypothetical protein